MKNFRYDLYKMGVADTKVAPHDGVDEKLISSKEYCDTYEVYIRDIAEFKTTRDNKGRKSKNFRATSYSAVGVMDKNDLIQEARFAFLHSYKLAMEKKAEGKFENGAALWAYIKGSTMLNLDANLRALKDGIKVPEWEYRSASKTGKESNGMIANHLTQLFSKMDVIFSERVFQEEVPRYEIELLGHFLDDVIYHEIPKQMGRDVLRSLFGLDEEMSTYSELSDYYEKGQSTIRTVKQRALDKLKQPKVKEAILDFLNAYNVKISSSVNSDLQEVSVTDRIKLKNN